MRLPVIYQSPEEALGMIKNGDRVFIHGSAQTPTNILRHLSLMADRLRDVELVFISVLGEIFVNNQVWKMPFGLMHFLCPNQSERT